MVPRSADPRRGVPPSAPSANDIASPALTQHTRPGGLTFEGVYEAHFPFVWRSVRRLLGLAQGSVDDVVQEVFVVVHRRLGDFEGRSSVKTWLFGVALRVVRDHRKTQRRKNPPPGAEASDDPEVIVDDAAHRPDERAEKAQAVRVLHQILDGLDDEKREIFVLAELEQMSAPEIADALAINLNTVYSRLRTARHEFEEAVARHRAQDEFTARARALPGRGRNEETK